MGQTFCNHDQSEHLTLWLVPRFVSGNIEILRKQNQLFPKWPIIKWFVIKQNKTKGNFEKCTEIPATASGNLQLHALITCNSRQRSVLWSVFPFDVIVLPAHLAANQQTVSLLDVMWPWASHGRAVARKTLHNRNSVLRTLSSRRGSRVRYINPLCEVYRRRKVEWIDQAENFCRMCVDFSYILVVFSYIAGFLDFGWIWQLETHRNPWLIMWLQFAFVFLKSYFIFSKKRSKVFYFEGAPETRGGSCACCLFLLE